MTTSPLDPVRLGLVVPGDCHVDDEFWRLAAPEAMPYVTRTRGASDERMGSDAIAETTRLADSPEVTMAAERLLDVTPSAAAYVDTSISFVRGIGGDTEIASRIERILGCPAIVTSTAVAAALSALGVSRMAVLSPYTDELDTRLAAYYTALGITTVAMATMSRSYPGGTTSRDLGRIHPSELVEDARRIAKGDSEALFIPCTAIRAVGAVDELEQVLGVPVVTSIQATLWAVLRIAGVTVPRRGVGALFEITELPEPFGRTLSSHA